MRYRASSDLAKSHRKPEALRGYLEANRDRALSVLFMSRQVQSLFWEVQKPLLGNPEALRDRALLVGCTRAIGYRASLVWVIKSTLN